MQLGYTGGKKKTYTGKLISTWQYIQSFIYALSFNPYKKWGTIHVRTEAQRSGSLKATKPVSDRPCIPTQIWFQSLTTLYHL